MCACGCIALAGLIAGLVYTVMHGLWLAAAAIVIASVLIGLFGKKAAGARKPQT